MPSAALCAAADLAFAGLVLAAFWPVGLALVAVVFFATVFAAAFFFGAFAFAFGAAAALVFFAGVLDFLAAIRSHIPYEKRRGKIEQRTLPDGICNAKGIRAWPSQPCPRQVLHCKSAQGSGNCAAQRRLGQEPCRRRESTGHFGFSTLATRAADAVRTALNAREATCRNAAMPGALKLSLRSA